MVISLVLFVIIITGSAFGLGYSVYNASFETGIHLPIYVTYGKNVTTIKAWDSKALEITPLGGKTQIDIYNYTSSGERLFQYNKIEDLSYEFWIGGAGNFTAYIITNFGSIFRNTPIYNSIIIHIDGSVSKYYGSILLKNLSVEYGSKEYYLTQYLLLNYGGLIYGKFQLYINFENYPSSISFSFFYPNDAGTILQYIGKLDNPVKVGAVSREPIAGRYPSPYEIIGVFQKSPNNGVFLFDNINIVYLMMNNNESSTPITIPIGITFFIAVPLAIYVFLKRRKY